MDLRRANDLCKHLALYLLVFALPACPSQRTNTPPVVQIKAPLQTPAETFSSEEVADEVVKLLVTTQLEYLERGNMKPFSALLAPNAKIQAARSRTPGPYDSAFGKQRLDNIYEWVVTNGDRAKANLITLDVHVMLDAVEVEMRLEEILGGKPYWFGQKFRLEKSEGQWQIARFRYWPMNPETKAEFTAEYFGNLDRLIEQNMLDGDDRNAAYNLLISYRFDECAILVRRLTENDPTDAWAWDVRATASAMIGDKEDANKSSKIARQLSDKPH